MIGQPNSSPQGAGGEFIQNTFSGIPNLTKVVSIGLSVGTIVGVLLWERVDKLLSLNAGYTVPPYFYVWNIVTSGFYERSLLVGIMDIVLLLLSGKFLEPIWGSKEFLKFILVVNVVSGLFSFILMVLLYFMVRSEYLLYDTNLCGFGGVIAGFTVAVKQLIPDQEFSVFILFKLKAKHLPGLIILIGIASFALGLPSKHLPHVLFGTLGAWVYLRFYQKKGEVTGDLSSSFAFDTFWPEPLQPIIAVITRIFAYPLRLCGIIPTPPPTSSYNPNYSPPSGGSLAPLGPDAERRRALAQRAIDARMAATVTHPKLTKSQIIQPNNSNNELIDSEEMIPEPSPPSLTNPSSRYGGGGLYPPVDKT